METTVRKKTKDFDTVKTFREIKKNISKDIWGLSYEELMKYFEDSKKNHQKDDESRLYDIA
jgi:hypothetical protein